MPPRASSCLVSIKPFANVWNGVKFILNIKVKVWTRFLNSLSLSLCFSIYPSIHYLLIVRNEKLNCVWSWNTIRWINQFTTLIVLNITKNIALNIEQQANNVNKLVYAYVYASVSITHRTLISETQNCILFNKWITITITDTNTEVIELYHLAITLYYILMIFYFLKGFLLLLLLLRDQMCLHDSCYYYIYWHLHIHKFI